MSEVIKSLLVLLGVLAKAHPEVAAFLVGMADGDSKCIDEVRKILPVDSASAAFVREHSA